MKYNIPMKKMYLATIPIAGSFLAAGLAARYEYIKTFYVRMAEPTGFTDRFLSDNPTLKHSVFYCMSSKGCLIRGLRFIPEGDPKALIVMTHGYNMSMESYLPLAKRFTDSGYMVLIFDGTGTGMSDGEGIYGLPQHTLDMKSVLDAVKGDSELSALPLLLFGHSWGGYAACTVSCTGDYPIRGILTCAAFRKSSSAMIPTIRKRYPRAAAVLIASVELLERAIFGPVASATSSEGLKKAGCPARLYHSTDDAVVSYKESFEAVRRAMRGNKEISFITMEGRNHDLYRKPESDKRIRGLEKELRKRDNNYLRNELWKLMSETDEDLADEFIEFFDGCLEK